MYVESGLGGYRTRRGLGVAYDEEGLPIEDPANTTYHDGTTYNQSGQKMGPPVPFTTSPISWLNQNSTMVAVGAGVFLVAILFAKAGR